MTCCLRALLRDLLKRYYSVDRSRPGRRTRQATRLVEGQLAAVSCCCWFLLLVAVCVLRTAAKSDPQIYEKRSVPNRIRLELLARF